MVPLRYGVEWSGTQYTAYVAIFRKDGTVSISHGGVEMGQGINTKVNGNTISCISFAFIHLPSYICLQTPVCIHLSAYTCLHTPVTIHMPAYTCLHTPV